MPEKRQNDDDRDRNPEQPQKNSSAHFLILSKKLAYSGYDRPSSAYVRHLPTSVPRTAENAKVRYCTGDRSEALLPIWMASSVTVIWVCRQSGEPLCMVCPD